MSSTAAAAGLGRAVPGQHAADGPARTAMRRRTRRPSAMTPSTTTGTPRGRAADDEAGEGGDLEPTDLGQHLERRRGVGGAVERRGRSTAILRASIASSMPVPRPGDAPAGAGR